MGFGYLSGGIVALAAVQYVATLLYGLGQVPHALRGELVPQVSAATCIVISALGMYGLYGTNQVRQLVAAHV